MGRWMKPEVYPLLAAMTCVCGMVVLQLTRNVMHNPAVRLKKSERGSAIVDNEEKGMKYTEHALRKFLRTRPPEIMPAVNRFFAGER
ncbi:hypothetical protein M569_11268, partial [Genlisea aurea]